MFLFFTRGIALFASLIISVVMLIITVVIIIKKKQKLLICVSLIVFVLSLFIPIRMFVLNQTSVPIIDTSDLNSVYYALCDKTTEGLNNLNNSDVINSNSKRLVYKNGDKAEFTVFVYDSSFDEEINAIKQSSVVYYSDDGISIWADEMSPTAFAWYSPIAGVVGSFVMENEAKSEKILIHYSIKEFDGSSSIFPTYPKTDVLDYVLNCSTLD